MKITNLRSYIKKNYTFQFSWFLLKIALKLNFKKWQFWVLFNQNTQKGSEFQKKKFFRSFALKLIFVRFESFWMRQSGWPLKLNYCNLISERDRSFLYTNETKQNVAWILWIQIRLFWVSSTFCSWDSKIWAKVKVIGCQLLNGKC